MVFYMKVNNEKIFITMQDLMEEMQNAAGNSSHTHKHSCDNPECECETPCDECECGKKEKAKKK